MSPIPDRSVIQRHIFFDRISGSYDRNRGRPNTHLSVGTLTGIVRDLIKKQPQNPAEQAFLDAVDGEAQSLGYAVPYRSPTLVADLVLQQNILSNYKFAICHKVPYKAFEKLLLEVIRDFNTQPQPSQENKEFAKFLDKTIGKHDKWNQIQKALQKSDFYAVELYSKRLCETFDGNSKNLYIGWKVTNSSVGDHFDLHWNSLGAGNATASPRGQAWADATNAAEQGIFGASQTTSDILIEPTGDQWALYSGLYGTKSAGTGYVQIK